MNLYKQIMLPAILGMWCCVLYAQENKYKCYQDFRSEGLRLMDKKNYGEASNQFWAALITCPEKPANNDLSDLIQQCQNNWVKDLEKAVQQQKEAYQTALTAQKQAEASKVLEEKARKEAEANAKLARERGIKAESLRLALLSDMIRQKGRKSDALTLAYLALQMAGSDTTGVMTRAFGDAVRDSMTEYWFDSPNAIESMQQVAGGQTVLVKTSDGPFYIIKKSGEAGSAARVTQLDAKFSQVVPTPAGDLFVAWGTTNTAQLLDAGGTVVATISGHTEAIRCAAFSPDGKTVATGSRDNTARLWDRGGKLLATLSGHNGNILDIAFSPDGDFLLTRSADGTARSWDIQGAPIAVFEAEGKFLRRVTRSPDGERIVGIFSDGSATLWYSGGARLVEFNMGNEKIQGDFFFALNAPVGVARLGNRAVGVWATDDGRLLHILNHPAQVTGLSVSPDGTQLLTWAKDRVVRRWDAGGALQREFLGHQQDILAASLSPDKAFILTTDKAGTAKLWDSSGNILTEWITGSNTPAQFSLDRRSVLLAPNGGRSLAFSPFPGNIYQSIDREKLLAGEAVTRLIGEFKVQFSEALFQTK